MNATDVISVWAFDIATKLRRSRFSSGNLRRSQPVAPKNAAKTIITPRVLAVGAPSRPANADAAVISTKAITANRAGRVSSQDTSLFFFFSAILKILMFIPVYFIITLRCFKTKTGRMAPLGTYAILPPRRTVSDVGSASSVKFF